MTTTTQTVPERAALATARITELLGPDVVTTDPELLLKTSADWSRMSPILQEKVPAGRYMPDAVVRPRTADDVARVLQVAYEHDVPVTPRGSGTGNYGQATPFDGGLVLDLRGLDTITVNPSGTVSAGAGAKITAIDAAARAAGRDIWIYPSTKGSTIGGFVGGGSAGTGTIEHGSTSDGYVVAVTVAPMDGSGTTFTVRGADAMPYVHVYGVTGVVVEVEVATEPAREWVAVYAAFDDWASMVQVHRSLLDLPVLPRLASADPPALVPSLPAAVELDPTRHSLRVIAEASTVAEVEARVLAAGGTVVATFADYAETDRLSSMSYNHPVYFLQKAHPERTWFHMETGGKAHWDDPDAVRAVYDGEVHLHLELMGHAPLAMVVADYVSEEQVLDGIPRLEALGLGVHSPHQWYVDRHVELARATARSTDPKGLLNPGKLVDSPPEDTRVNIGVR
ncbi:FAD/FMN-containing dehydrogenase [Isoptericola jiangsuensis]|uniref:FAD/FMN-containing dehydrogenase n=1 Tax=Isoptericola jiangsuensis TaxID=548579 RepID=A0A2A9ESM0_9MICO|nr:FAD-binding oxidoreductase [Isoptericola jiangsuensis]PFG41878.1 FAD/FMN-containing dehydrogenase [Isoptericola jiangsuensis]